MLKSTRSLVILVLFAVVAAPVSAELFTITLTNGNTFKTRYQPMQSQVDEGELQFLTDTGNWISLEKAIVESVTSETESKGFGTVIDTQTIALGWDPTSVAAQEDLDAVTQDPTTQLLNYLREQDSRQSEPLPVFSNDLVVEPSEAGGIPVWMTGMTTPPLGGRRGQR